MVYAVLSIPSCCNAFFFLPLGRRLISHYTQTQTTIIHKRTKYTLTHYMYTNKLNKLNTRQLCMCRSSTDYRNHI